MSLNFALASLSDSLVLGTHPSLRYPLPLVPARRQKQQAGRPNPGLGCLILYSTGVSKNAPFVEKKTN